MTEACGVLIGKSLPLSVGERPHAQMAYKPSKVGYVFLNGIRDENTNS